MCEMCDNPGMTYAEYHARMAAKIVEFGWMIQGVGPADDRSQEQFAYTIGLAPFGPELMIRGLPMREMQGILNLLAERITKNEEIDLNGPVTGILFSQGGGDVPVMLVRPSDAVDDADWTQAIGFHQRAHELSSAHPAEFERLFVLWPDAEGRLPTDPKCDPLVAEVQKPW